MKPTTIKHTKLWHAAFFLVLICAFYSCKKIDVKPEQTIVERFLAVPANASPQIKRIIEDLKIKNEQQPFIETFVARYGYPKWQYAKIFEPKQSIFAKEGDSPEIVEIPIAMEAAKYVDALLNVKMDLELMYKLFLAEEVVSLGFDKMPNRPHINAEEALVKIMEYEKQIWDEHYYEIKDSRFFDYWPAGMAKPAVFNVDFKKVGEANVVVYICDWETTSVTTVVDCSCWCTCTNTTVTHTPIVCVDFIPETPWGDGPTVGDDPGLGNGGWSSSPGSNYTGSPNSSYGGSNSTGNNGNIGGPCSGLPWGRLQYSPTRQAWISPCPQAPLTPEEEDDKIIPPFVWSLAIDDGTAFTDSNPLEEPDFQFDPSDNYETNYPRFTNLVKNLKTFVKNNPKVLIALQKYTGLTKQQIIDDLSFGQGPTIKIEDMTRKFGFYNKNAGNNTLHIRASYVRGLEQSFLVSTQQATAFLLAVTILHEFVHLGTSQNNISEGVYDFGLGFERDAFNVIISDDNAGTVYIRFNQYF